MVGIAMGESSASGWLLMIGNGTRCRDVCGTERGRDIIGNSLEWRLFGFLRYFNTITYIRSDITRTANYPPEEKAMPARVSIPTVRGSTGAKVEGSIGGLRFRTL